MHNRSLEIALAICGLAAGAGIPREKRQQWLAATGLPGIQGAPSVNQRYERSRGAHGSTRIRAFKRLKNRARNGS